MEKHARLGPSNKRWPYCPGSVREEKVYPDVSGDAAVDGTGSHILLELSLIHNVPASNYDQLIIGDNHHDKPLGWLINVERCKRVQIALDYVTRRKKELLEQFPGSKVIVKAESKSDPGVFIDRDDWWGTCDITIMTIDEEGLVLFIEVVDYKDGRMYVSEKWNTQLIAYLFGKLNGEVRDIGLRMTIIQPKTNTPIRYFCSTRPEDGLNINSLMEKVTWLTECAKATDDPNAPLIPGEHCQWCKHNPKRGGSCTATIDKSIEVIMPNKEFVIQKVESPNGGLLDIIGKAVSDIKSLSSEQLSKIADAEDGFKAAFDKVKKEMQERIETGGTIPGWTMLPGRASKIWAKDEETIVKKLKAKRFKKDEIYPAKLVSPATALKSPNLTETQKKKIKEELIVEMAGKMTLRKVEYEPVKNVADMFMGVDPAAEGKDKSVEVSFF